MPHCMYLPFVYVDLQGIQQLERCYSIGSFKKHEMSHCHCEAVEMMVPLPATTHDVGEALSRQYAKEKEEYRQILLKIISNIRFLAR